jgi:hypothetical protein
MSTATAARTSEISASGRGQAANGQILREFDAVRAASLCAARILQRCHGDFDTGWKGHEVQILGLSSRR